MKKFILSAAMLAASAAHAHVSLEQRSAPAGTYQKLTFRVGHGCNGSATQSITIQLPEGFAGLKPMPKQGWQIERGAATLTWRGGPLPDDYYEEFVAFGKLPAQPASHVFKITQACVVGSMNWETTLDTVPAAPAPAAHQH